MVSDGSEQELNPYVALDVSAPDGSELPVPKVNSRPETLGIVLSVIGGIVTAVFIFCMTFFVTCLGALSASGGPSLNVEAMVGISIVTAIIGAVLASIGILKLVRLFQR